jgi:hypothetical protein
MTVRVQRDTRTKLSLAFAGIPSRAAFGRRSPTLSGGELRRIVADLIG